MTGGAPGPTLELERSVLEEYGSLLIAGVDEAGRGALAGPVVAAAVILPLHDPARLALLNGVNDSKQLAPAQREALFELIIANAIAYGIGSVPASTIDAIGILPANAQAMAQAVDQLRPAPHFLLIDGRMNLPQLPISQQAVIGGDYKSLSIAAASILAKVARDHFMINLEAQYPAYGFARHKGYSTYQHKAALAQHGPCPVHRFSFAPVKGSVIGNQYSVISTEYRLPTTDHRPLNADD